MKIKLLGIGIVAGAMLFSAGLILSTQAQETNGGSNLQFPVAELGNCGSKAECKAFCDKPANTEACIAFAQKNNLMDANQAALALKMASKEITGPGGCKSQKECESYCDNTSHIDECVSFAETNNLMSGQELAEARKVRDAIKQGIKPPACGSKKSCDQYCSDSSHIEECVTFAMQAGLMDETEKADAQKMLQAVKRGIKPPACKGKQECDQYCSSPSHTEECVTFAIEAGMMSDSEKADAQKMLQAVKAGVKPPACRGKDECDKYCSEDAHVDECINFAAAAGFMKPEEAEVAKKTKGKGPGGCKNREECDAFCGKPENQQTCFNFGKENGLISAEDLQKMQEGDKQFRESINNAPPKVKECLTQKFGDLSTLIPSKESGGKMKECFEQFGGPQGGPQGNPGQGFNGLPNGPGGCNSPESCEAYCKEHPSECQSGPGQGPRYNENSGGPRPENGHQGTTTPGVEKRTGPGGCTSPESCEAYCKEHPSECGAPGSGNRQMPPPDGQQMPPLDRNSQMSPYGGNLPPPNSTSTLPTPTNSQSQAPANVQIQPVNQTGQLPPSLGPGGTPPPAGTQLPPPPSSAPQPPPPGGVPPLQPNGTQTPPPTSTLMYNLVGLLVELFKRLGQ